MLIPKYMFLIHLIVEKCSADKDGFAYLPTSKYEPIFGRQFYEMLHTLEDMKIISMGYYQNGVNSRPITLNDWHIEEVDTKNRKVIELAKEVEKKTKSERPCTRLSPPKRPRPPPGAPPLKAQHFSPKGFFSVGGGGGGEGAGECETPCPPLLSLFTFRF